MNKRKLAVALILGAVVLTAGAYMLIADPIPEGPVLRQPVAPPDNNIAKAPNWVNKGQSPKPDYSSATAKAQNATQVPAAPQKAPQTIEVSEDKVVTFTFVESLADFLLHRFQPQAKNGRPATLASAKALNMYYGRELDGFFAPGDDIRTARKNLLDNVFTPARLEFLYKLYAPAFLEHLTDTAEVDERIYSTGDDKQSRTLSKAEIAAMLTVNAPIMEQTAKVFRTIAADPSITEMAGRYLRSAKAVGRANLQLQNAIADDKNATKAGQRLKQAILQRESVKAAIVSRLKKSCRGCDSSDLFYLSMWAYRRVSSDPDTQLPTFKTAADILDDLAKKFRQKAAAIQ